MVEGKQMSSDTDESTIQILITYKSGAITRNTMTEVDSVNFLIDVDFTGIKSILIKNLGE